MRADEQQRLQDAVQGSLGDGEIAVAWTLTIDVLGPGDRRHLAHRAGGGADGDNAPMVWTALGMLRASVIVAETQVLEATRDTRDDDEPEGEG